MVLPSPSVRVLAHSRPSWLVDVVERVTVLSLYVWLVTRIIFVAWNAGEWVNLLLLPSEGLVAVFVLIRRPTARISRRPVEWGLAAAATICPLLVAPGVGDSLVAPAVAAFLLLAGVLIQLCAKWALGRSFGCIPAHRGLRLNGPYRFVRHPMYAGYLLSHMAFLAINPTGWNVLVYGLCYALQIPRLLAEERFLASDPEYRRYCHAVRNRLIPGVF